MLTAIIPARGGSKGVKRKNLRKVNGRTLLEIAIEKAQQVADVVVVSSDDGEMLEIAENENAIPFLRSDKLATDEAMTVDVLREVSRVFRLDEILLVQCTAPLARAEDFRRCVNERQPRADMAVLCHRFHGAVLPVDPLATLSRLTARRQDVPPQYLIAGSAWSFHVDYLNQAFYSGTVQPVEVSGPVCDIDTEDDLLLADTMARRLAPCPVAKLM